MDYDQLFDGSEYPAKRSVYAYGVPVYSYASHQVLAKVLLIPYTWDMSEICFCRQRQKHQFALLQARGGGKSASRFTDDSQAVWANIDLAASCMIKASLPRIEGLNCLGGWIRQVSWKSLAVVDEKRQGARQVGFCQMIKAPSPEARA